MNGDRHTASHWVRRIAVAITGTAVILAGFAMIPLPVPGMIIIPAGLGILATEFVWAKTLLGKVNLVCETIKKRIDLRRRHG